VSLPCSREFPASRLEIDGFCLRPFVLADAPHIVQALNESTAALQKFMPWAHIPQTLEGQVKRIRAALSANAEGTDFSFGFFEGSRFVAGCGLHPRVALNPNGTEIGFWTRSSASGRGLATLMTQLLVVYALEGLAMDRIQIAHNPGNTASQRVVEKCGFVFEGVVRNETGPVDQAAVSAGLSPCRDVKMYSLLPDEARALPWYRAVAARVRVFDQVGNDLGSIF